eukprot:TRINITY_DN18466_c0_g1_i5.p1 TRINITY_DN18466_c0_g1~~TRINITY_DN18466_c0_g1_i5.p1  ORF type:complete len:510 (+),score=39.49 TRINITY_DN18466_c0_g1_i5:126-1655(+)
MDGHRDRNLHPFGVNTDELESNVPVQPPAPVGIALHLEAPMRLAFDVAGIVDRQSTGIIPEAWADRKAGTDMIMLALQPRLTARVVWREAGPVLLACILSSALSFAAGYVLFGHVLHGPGDSDDVEYWTTCNATTVSGGEGGGELKTPLAEAYPLEVVRTKTSALKYWSIALICGFVPQFLLHDATSTMLVVAVCTSIAAVSTGNLVYGWIPMPTVSGNDLTDQLVSLASIVSLFSIMAARTSPQDIDSSGMFRWPRTVLYGSLAIAFISETILVNASYHLTIEKATTLSPTASATLCLLLVKIMDFLMRVLFKYTKVPPWPCLSIAFIYESAILYVIRRSIIRNTNISDVLLTTLFFSIVEVLSKLLGILYCIHLYNVNIARGRGDLARRQMAIFFLGIISDMAAEHAALQASLGLIAIDSRVYDIEVDSHVILVSWVIQFLAECGVDVFVMVCMVAVLPVSIVNVDAFERRHLRQILFGFCFYIVSACVFIFTPTLHLFIREDSFVF